MNWWLVLVVVGVFFIGYFTFSLVRTLISKRKKSTASGEDSVDNKDNLEN